MVVIMPSSELRNSYNTVSEFCRKTSEPVYLTKNGRDDTVLLSVENYETISRMALMYKIEHGVREVDPDADISKVTAISELRRDLGL